MFDLARLRTQLAITHAFDGFNIEQDMALTLIRNLKDDNLTELDKETRKRLVAAIDNLIEFSVCEEYHLMQDIYSEVPDFDFDDEIYDFPDDEEDYDEDDERLIGLCLKYNKIWAGVENMDIEYAMGIAYAWIHYARTQYLTYMTQNDDRVRPWHYALQGFTAKRDEFPAWMIPPIEWGCRCFLEDHEGNSVENSSPVHDVKALKIPKKPKQLDDVFSESVATCGRIFGKSHKYFQVGDKDKPILKEFVERIKSEYYG